MANGVARVKSYRELIVLARQVGDDNWANELRVSLNSEQVYVKLVQRSHKRFCLGGMGVFHG